jgi:hypothetical protein
VPGQVGRVDPVSAQTAQLAGPGKVIPSRSVDQGQGFAVRIIGLVGLVVEVVEIGHADYYKQKNPPGTMLMRPVKRDRIFAALTTGRKGPETGDGRRIDFGTL